MARGSAAWLGICCHQSPSPLAPLAPLAPPSPPSRPPPLSLLPLALPMLLPLRSPPPMLASLARMRLAPASATVASAGSGAAPAMAAEVDADGASAAASCAASTAAGVAPASAPLGPAGASRRIARYRLGLSSRTWRILLKSTWRSAPRAQRSAPAIGTRSEEPLDLCALRRAVCGPALVGATATIPQPSA